MRLCPSAHYSLRSAVTALGLAATWMLAATAARAQFTFAPPQNYAVAASPKAVQAADLDLDGDTDLVTSNGSSFSLLINAGNGTFAPARTAAVRASIKTFVLGDLDGDSDPDAISGNLNLDFGVSVFLNDNDGEATFGRVRNFTTANNLGLKGQLDTAPDSAKAGRRPCAAPPPVSGADPEAH
ncbi:MAG: VCBS repeat-containing protein [Aphanocapsa lilacina HA4352-LM1]|jgi:hypothetical protein|nr:VCBS repeat-containing protein [Aphanocapsa lilacina HA4352-LM1]